jgi:hypothetical protein
MARFVILRHEMPTDDPRASHWDLMLEDGPRLRTWALPRLPSLDQLIMVDALTDHRLAYLNNEGPVSRGRGRVTAWDRGELEWLVNDADRVVAIIRGERIQAHIRLTLDSATQRWFLDVSPLDPTDRG